ncbi:MAG: hydroxyacid dehydrogenase [Anaerolineae bacterium]|nr:MAG: hydroxyacid dehydrogenase [Anaerolineae bacterium]
MTLRILNLEPDGYSPQARRILESCGEVIDGSLSRADLLAALPGYDVLITRFGHHLDHELFSRATRLKALVTATTGLDHIDLVAAAEKGIAVLSLKGETEFLRSVPATAEHTWALLLALVRRLHAAVASVQAGQWARDPFRGHDLAGKRLGLVGVGRIGSRVAGYGLAFGMQVGGYDPHPASRVSGVTYFDTLPALLAWSQIISIHVPLEPATAGLIGAEQLAALPSGAWLINTSRGAVVDESALLAALGSGHLAGAALDVLENEAALQAGAPHPLVDYARTYDNLLITPHIGGATFESMAMTEVFMAEKLKAFLSV